MNFKLKKCLEAMEREAKLGRVCGRYSVDARTMKFLEDEGFTVIRPRNYTEAKFSKKNFWEVKISWKVPTVASGSAASRFYDMVENYRNKCNATKRDKNLKKEHLSKAAFRLETIHSWSTDDEAKHEEDFYEWAAEVAKAYSEGTIN